MTIIMQITELSAIIVVGAHTMQACLGIRRGTAEVDAGGVVGDRLA